MKENLKKPALRKQPEKKQPEKMKPEKKKPEIKKPEIKKPEIRKSEKAPVLSCPVERKCGGCSLLYMPYAKQLAKKQRMVEDLILDFCPVEPILGMKDPYHYRNKVNATFAYTRDRKIVSGIYQEGTHRVVPVESCLIEDETADAVIRTIRDMLPSFRIKTYDEDTGYGLLRHVQVRVGKKSGQIMVVLVLASPILPSKNNFVKALLKAHPQITTIILNVNDKKTTMVLGERNITLYGPGYIEDQLGDLTFRISPGSFYQVNSAQTERLYATAIEFAGLTGKEIVMDAYCGIGTIGLFAASKAARVIGVELNAAAVADARINAKRNKIQNADFFAGDAGDFCRKMIGTVSVPDVVFMDPPRSGSTEAFMKSVITMEPKSIVYISCNPETLARDLEYMTKRGKYKVVRCKPVDMFPATEHVEVVSLLQKMSNTREKMITLDVEMEDYHRIKNRTEVTADATE